MAATLQYCTMYGIMAVAVTPNLMLAAVLSSAFYSMWNLFAGFIIPKPVRAQSGITFLVSCPCRLLLIAQKELAVEQGQSHASAVQARHRLCFAMHAAALFSRTEMLAGERCMQQPEGRGVLSLLQRIPDWWGWYYNLNPFAWSNYGLVASQLGHDFTHSVNTYG